MAGDNCRGNRITGDINAYLHHADKRIHTHNKAHRFGRHSNLRHEKSTADKRGSRNARRTKRRTIIDTNREVIMLPVIVTPKIFAIKRAVMMSVMHEPFILMVEPSGSEKEYIFFETPISSVCLIDVGNVALLEAREKAVIMAG